MTLLNSSSAENFAIGLNAEFPQCSWLVAELHGEKSMFCSEHPRYIQRQFFVGVENPTDKLAQEIRDHHKEPVHLFPITKR